MATKETLLEELTWRGLLYQQTEGLGAHFEKNTVTAYCGFDPTAASLHIGNLVPTMLLVHVARHGHNAIALVGGGTAMIGDPSGKSEERPLASADEITANAARIHAQLSGLFASAQTSGVTLANNADWLLKVGAVDFMRDVGKHFSVNYMLAKDSVQSRIETGISYTEFSYLLLQAYDYLQLFKKHGCTLQVGGSDQWGNITAGMELVRRSAGGEAHVLTAPLITTASGKKFGKTEAGAVWLDPEMTSPYQFYQFWINTEDADVGRYLRMFTFMSRAEIEALEMAHAKVPHERSAQRQLAAEVTSFIHGNDTTGVAGEVSSVVFDKRRDPARITDPVYKAIMTWIPSAAYPGATELDILALLEDAFKVSRSAGRKLVQQGGVSVNGEKLSADSLTVPRDKAVRGRWFLVRKGGRDIALADVG
jgi:tyrosyl-tRNA synthetase